MQALLARSELWQEIHDRFGDKGGIYTLSCLSQDDSRKVVPINRLLAEDAEGLLYIGMARSFLDRVINLKKSLSPEHVSQAHDCGVRYKGSETIQARFPYDRLLVTLTASDAPREAERAVLDRYKRRFGELPPLNRVD
jgi:hypothetical protein